MTAEEGQDQNNAFEYLAHPKPRPGQVEMIRESTEALRSNGYHLAAAPTGIGKTAAALSAALEITQASATKKHVFFLRKFLGIIVFLEGVRVDDGDTFLSLLYRQS